MRGSRRPLPERLGFKALALLSLLVATPLSAETDPAPSYPISYRLEPAHADLHSRYTKEQLALLEKLNRADARHLPRLRELVVPERWGSGDIEHSPLPLEIPELSPHPKALIVHQPIQVFGAYERNRLVRWGPVSSGRREHPTPSGAFHLNWRSRARRSTVNPSWHMEWYFNFDNRRGLALHKYALPGRPASHACIRLLERDARWIFEWGEGWELDADRQRVIRPGTPVWIVAKYDFHSPPPWLAPENPHPRVDLTIGSVP